MSFTTLAERFKGNELLPVSYLRGTGKSMMLRDLAMAIHQAAPEPIYYGRDLPRAGRDEIVEGRAAIPVGDIIAKFEDPLHPRLTVYATLEKLDRRDPRNPNPNAGVTRQYHIVHNGRTERVRNRTTAIAMAEATHNRLIAEALAQEAELDRRRLAAIEQARADTQEAARRTHEHLQALPAYGGF